MHLTRLVCAVAAATLLVVGCGSDSGSGGTGGAGGTGGSGGSGGSTSGTQCTGDYASVTEAAFMANLSTDGACIGASDADSVCTKNVTAAAQTCGAGCFAMGGDVPTQDACTSSCIAGMVTPLSNDCLSCYVADVACARAHCLVKCGTAPMSTDCADCRETNHCTSDFYTCAGVPLPSGAASGGAGG